MSKSKKTCRCLCSKEMFVTSKMQTPKSISMFKQPSKMRTMNSNLTTKCQEYSASSSFCRKSMIKPLNQTTQRLQKTPLARKDTIVQLIKCLRKSSRRSLNRRHHLKIKEEHKIKTFVRFTLENRLRKTKKAKNSQARKLVV